MDSWIVVKFEHGGSIPVDVSDESNSGRVILLKTATGDHFLIHENSVQANDEIEYSITSVINDDSSLSYSSNLSFSLINDREIEPDFSSESFENFRNYFNVTVKASYKNSLSIYKENSFRLAVFECSKQDLLTSLYSRFEDAYIKVNEIHALPTMST